MWFAAILVIAILAPAGSLRARFFGHPFLRMMGKYSYGLYMFHYILNGLLSRALPATTLAAQLHTQFGAVLVRIAAGFAGSLALAMLSWHLYEKHFLKLKKYFERTVPTVATRPIELPGGVVEQIASAPAIVVGKAAD